MRLGRRIIATQHILQRKAVGQANGLQRDMCQLPGIARENAQAITAPGQLAHQFHRTRCRLRTEGQVPLMLQQPGMFGCGLIGWQRGEVGQDVVFGRDRQRHANRREVVHGHRQGAVHVEHPVTHFGQAHAQSLR
ncbi:hypothetical protein D3C78_863350 [compost metagenome]